MADPKDCEHIGNVSDSIKDDEQVSTCNDCGKVIRRIPLD